METLQTYPIILEGNPEALYLSQITANIDGILLVLQDKKPVGYIYYDSCNGFWYYSTSIDATDVWNYEETLQRLVNTVCDRYKEMITLQLSFNDSTRMAW